MERCRQSRNFALLKKPDPGQMAALFTLLGDHDSALPLLEQVCLSVAACAHLLALGSLMGLAAHRSAFPKPLGTRFFGA